MSCKSDRPRGLKFHLHCVMVRMLEGRDSACSVFSISRAVSILFVFEEETRSATIPIIRYLSMLRGGLSSIAAKIFLLTPAFSTASSLIISSKSVNEPFRNRERKLWKRNRDVQKEGSRKFSRRRTRRKRISKGN